MALASPLFTRDSVLFSTFVPFGPEHVIVSRKLRSSKFGCYDWHFQNLVLFPRFSGLGEASHIQSDESGGLDFVPSMDYLSETF